MGDPKPPEQTPVDAATPRRCAATEHEQNGAANGERRWDVCRTEPERSTIGPRRAWVSR